MLPQIKTILYTTALNPYTRPVLRFTVGLATQYHAKIVLLHVVEPLSTSTRFLIESYLPSEKIEELHRGATANILQLFHTRLEKFCEEELNSTLSQTEVLSEIRVVNGLPHEIILKEADRCNADLIVMGSHANSPNLADRFLGSTTRRITLSSKRPVLVVPFIQAPDNEWPAQHSV